MKEEGAPPGAWAQPSPRAEMLSEVKGLEPAARTKRLAIRHGKPGHIDDEVVVTLMLLAWRSGQEREADTFAAEVLRRVVKQVRAHVRKNSGWQLRGGGAKAAIDDFGQSTVIAILEDSTVPCHAEVAFGNYVYRRCLDEAGKLYAKKHSAGKSLDEEDEDVEAAAQDGDHVGSPAAPKSPEQVLIEFEEFLEESQTEKTRLERIRHIVQSELPELAQFAFTYRYYANLKIESKKEGAVTVTSLMGVNEKTATKYIKQAIEIIKQRLEQ
jgi:hypothetical protein